MVDEDFIANFDKLHPGQVGPLVDDKSFELAEHFLRGETRVTEDDKWSLAEAIQTAVENWFQMRDHEAIVFAEGEGPSDVPPTYGGPAVDPQSSNGTPPNQEK